MHLQDLYLYIVVEPQPSATYHLKNRLAERQTMVQILYFSLCFGLILFAQIKVLFWHILSDIIGEIFFWLTQINIEMLR